MKYFFRFIMALVYSILNYLVFPIFLIVVYVGYFLWHLSPPPVTEYYLDYWELWKHIGRIHVDREEYRKQIIKYYNNAFDYLISRNRVTYDEDNSIVIETMTRTRTGKWIRKTP
jgi:hypothetical protein